MEGLAHTDARLSADLTAALGVLRDSAAELLGLDLAVPESGGRLAEDRRFFYTTAERPARPSCSRAIRRPAPRRAGGARPASTCDARPPAWWPSQIGRARADLRYRLSEASRP